MHKSVISDTVKDPAPGSPYRQAAGGFCFALPYPPTQKKAKRLTVQMQAFLTHPPRLITRRGLV